MLVFLTIFTSFSLLLWILVLVALIENYEKEPKLSSFSYPAPSEDSPLVSVIVPARNEQENIGACLEAVLSQDYPRFELIVVDDRSEDQTRQVVEEFTRKDSRVQLVKGKPLPPGWAGKCHAIEQGVEKAKGDWLLMLDSDTFLAPRCLAVTVQDAMARKVDLYTLIFETQCVSFWEKVVQPLFFQLILMVLPLHRINDPGRKEAAAPGPFLLFQRESYLAIGGHKGMKEETVEDLQLAKRTKEEGYRIYVANAVSLVTNHRGTSFRQIWHGWSRVFYSGIEKNPFIALLAFIAMGLFLLLPWVIPLYAILELIRAGVSPLPVALLVLAIVHCLVFLVIRSLLTLFYRIDGSLSYLQPLAVLLAMAILINSVWAAGRAHTWEWKGRRY